MRGGYSTLENIISDNFIIWFMWSNWPELNMPQLATNEVLYMSRNLYLFLSFGLILSVSLCPKNITIRGSLVNVKLAYIYLDMCCEKHFAHEFTSFNCFKSCERKKCWYECCSIKVFNNPSVVAGRGGLRLSKITLSKICINRYLKAREKSLFQNYSEKFPWQIKTSKKFAQTKRGLT